MRLTPLILACTLTCALAACDQTQQTAAINPVAPSPPPACNCQPAPPPPTVASTPVLRTTHRHYRHYRMAYSESQESTSEADVTDYGYNSDSHVDGDTEAVTQTRTAWTDGFGRAYGPGHARRSGTMTRNRLKPWAHYDEDCDDGR
ncbi:MAG TPA: hypothetical protein VGG48_10730 [Rhizomicrobium sp.]|jgi:hypothetical protein